MVLCISDGQRLALLIEVSNDLSWGTAPSLTLVTAESEGKERSQEILTPAQPEWCLSLLLTISCSELACGPAQSHESKKAQSYHVPRRHRKLRWLILVSTTPLPMWTKHPPSPEKVYLRLHSCQSTQTSPLPLLLFWDTSLQGARDSLLEQGKKHGSQPEETQERLPNSHLFSMTRGQHQTGQAKIRENFISKWICCCCC